MKINDEWDLTRIIASSRVMLIITIPTILISLFAKLPKKSKLGFLILSFVLFV